MKSGNLARTRHKQMSSQKYWQLLRISVIFDCFMIGMSVCLVSIFLCAVLDAVPLNHFSLNKYKFITQKMK